MSFTGLSGTTSSSSSTEGSSSRSLSVQPGKVKIDPSFALQGDQNLDHLNMALMDQPIKLGGSDVISPQLTNPRGIISKHDYILLQFGELWIKAEKGGESEPGRDDAGIYVFPAHVKFDVLEDLWAKDGSSIRFQTNNIRLGNGKKAWSLGCMLRLLSSGDADYHVLGNNCWKHAYDGVEGVLIWSIENAEAPDVQEALRAKLDELKKVERPIPLHLLKSVAHPSAPESVKARETLKQKLAHTAELLPEGSKRGWGVNLIRKAIGS